MVANVVTGYDQDNRVTSVTEDGPAGNVLHITAYGYDAASNLTAMTHDNAQSTYAYNNLNLLAKQTDATSPSDATPQVSTFSYDAVGLPATQVKPNGNTVTATYYANGLPFQLTECTAASPTNCSASGATLVSSHTFAYDPNGNTASNTEQLMSADSGGGYLSHTLGYGYDPMDRVSSVTTDGPQTEAYTHDAGNNITRQTIGNVTTNYAYTQGRLTSASIVGGATSFYNYDPFGRLDTVTSSGGQTLQSNTYDGFDKLASTSQFNPATNSWATTSYTYDSLNRMVSQKAPGGQTTFSYVGLSTEVASESDPGGTAKAYDYTPGGMRTSQTTTPSGGTPTPGYYTYNDHSDVEAVTGQSGTPTATYGYTAYGSPVASMFTGADKNNATPSATSTATPYNSYRFNAMRWDSTSGAYDMGFRNYDPGLNQFTTRDSYDGALADSGLATDPFTGSQYAFGDGNPITNIELDGHNWLGGGIPAVPADPVPAPPVLVPEGGHY